MVQKRILHVVGAMNRGGAETMLMSMYRKLDKRTFQFDFLELSSGESDYAEEIRNMGGRILKCNWNQSPLYLRQTIRELTSLLVREGPFVAVHSHVLFASGTVLLAAARAGITVRVAHSHTTSSRSLRFPGKIYQVLARRMILKSSSHLVACTAAAGDFLYGEKKFAIDGIVIPNAVDLDEFKPNSHSSDLEVQGSREHSPRGLRIISVARLEPVKNHMFLIAVAGALTSRNVDFNMMFVGDGSLRSALETEVSKHGLNDRVHFLGVRENISEFMQSSDVLVLPSHFEGLPVTLVEAQATGLACLISEHVSREADMGLGLTKFLPIKNPEVWADALSEPLPIQPAEDEILLSLQQRGYSVEASLRTALSIYFSNEK